MLIRIGEVSPLSNILVIVSRWKFEFSVGVEARTKTVIIKVADVTGGNSIAVGTYSTLILLILLMTFTR